MIGLLRRNRGVSGRERQPGELTARREAVEFESYAARCGEFGGRSLTIRLDNLCGCSGVSGGF